MVRRIERWIGVTNSSKAASQVFQTFSPLLLKRVDETADGNTQMHVPITGAVHETHGSRPTETTFLCGMRRGSTALLARDYRARSDSSAFIFHRRRGEHMASPRRERSLMGSWCTFNIFFLIQGTIPREESW